jgi:hypothetical protein
MRRTAVCWLVALLTLAALLPPAGADKRREALSGTNPPINLTHIFEGEINRQGRPVGFHARPGGRDPSGARVVRVVDRPNRQGVYTAEVEIRTRDGRWLEKRSTFYPDRLSREDVVTAVLNAWRRRSTGSSENFRGPSGFGFTIEGWYQNGRINTAYPIFQQDRRGG